MVQFAHAALFDLSVNIANLPQNVPLWWKKINGRNRNLLSISMVQPQLTWPISIIVHVLQQKRLMIDNPYLVDKHTVDASGKA